MFTINNKKLRELIKVSSLNYAELSYPLHCCPNTIGNKLRQPLKKHEKQRIINAIKLLNSKRTQAVNQLSKEALN